MSQPIWWHLYVYADGTGRQGHPQILCTPENERNVSKVKSIAQRVLLLTYFDLTLMDAFKYLQAAWWDDSEKVWKKQHGWHPCLKGEEVGGKDCLEIRVCGF